MRAEGASGPLEDTEGARRVNDEEEELEIVLLQVTMNEKGQMLYRLSPHLSGVELLALEGGLSHLHERVHEMLRPPEDQE